MILTQNQAIDQITEQMQNLTDIKSSKIINYEEEIPDTLHKQLQESQKLSLEDFTAPQSDINSQRSIPDEKMFETVKSPKKVQETSNRKNLNPNSASKKIFDEEEDDCYMEDSKPNQFEQQELTYLYQDNDAKDSKNDNQTHLNVSELLE